MRLSYRKLSAVQHFWTDSPKKIAESAFFAGGYCADSYGFYSVQGLAGST